MAENSAYCKAFLARSFRAFPGWKENISNLRPDKKDDDGKEVEIKRTKLNDDDVLYLHDTLVVCDGVFSDEHIIFNNVTDQWKEFCEKELKFTNTRPINS